MRNNEPHQKTDATTSGSARLGELDCEIPEELYFFTNPCIIAEYSNGIIIYDCYMTDGSNLESEGIVEFVISRQLSFLDGEQPQLASNLGLKKLHNNDYMALHFYMEWLIDSSIKNTTSLAETKKTFETLINKQ